MTLLVGNPHPQDSTFCLLWLVVAHDKTIELFLLRLVALTNITNFEVENNEKNG